MTLAELKKLAPSNGLDSCPICGHSFHIWDGDQTKDWWCPNPDCGVIKEFKDQKVFKANKE